MAQAEKTAMKAKLAERLINGLSGEFQRWSATIKELSSTEGAGHLLSPLSLLCFRCHSVAATPM